jgi:CDP-6-deoxy-D-xylo-4-hexulose-3-dehydrase
MLEPDYLKVPLASSGLRDQDIKSAIEVLNSGNLTMGDQVKKFESAMASYLGSKYFVMVNSGSSANLAMIEAAVRPVRSKPSLLPGDGVLVPAIAWPTTVWTILQLGLKPVFVDVDASTLAIDLELAQDVINSSPIPIRGLFPIHVLGRGLSTDDLESFARKNELLLINDVCESLGSWDGNRHAGLGGAGGSFSFYFSHHITTMEGGGIATNDSEIADDLRSIRSHGWSRDRSDAATWVPDNADMNSKFLFVSTGFNIRPMEIQAAIGLNQIRDIDLFISRRRELAKLVNDAISGSQLELIGADRITGTEIDKQHSWMMLPIRVAENSAIDLKTSLIQYLELHGIETRPVLTGNFLAQPAMKRINVSGYDQNVFSSANDVAKRTFLLGAHHDFSNEQMNHIAECLRYFILNNDLMTV